MTLTQTNKIYSVQALRGIAALLVLGFHLGGYINQNYKIGIANSIFEFGFSGVDFFFVLSGFIITYSSHLSIGQPKKIKEYFFKRIFRILPIYWLVITPLFICTILLSSIVNSQYTFTISNLIQTYFVLPNHPKLLIISWTLSHEIYFYLLFSLIIISRKLAIIPIIILSGSLLNWVASEGNLPNTLFNFIFSPLNFEFFFGVLIFLIHKKFTPSYSLAIFVLILGIGWFIIPYQLISINGYQRIIMFGIPSSLILWSILSLEKLNSIKTPELLNSIGDASYMIYLIHYPIISILNKLAMKGHLINYINPLLFNFFVALSIIYVSLILYKRIERPTLKLFYSFIPSRVSISREGNNL